VYAYHGISVRTDYFVRGSRAAESSRDDWKPGRDHHANEDLAYSLATAPFLTTGDRDGIARVIEDQEDEERKRQKPHELPVWD